MSYILEALKKAQAERQLGSAPTIHAVPIQPVASERSRTRSMPLLIGLGAVALAVAGGAAWWNQRTPAPAPVPGAVVQGDQVQAAAPVVALVPAPAQPAGAPALGVPAAAPAAAYEPTRAPVMGTSAVVAARQPLPVTRPLPVAPPPAPVVASRAAPPQYAPAPVARTAAPPAVSEPAPVAPEESLPLMHQLPESQRSGLPQVAFGGYMYSKNPADRLLLIDKVLRREGEEVAPGLVLERLLPRAAVMNYRGTRYRVPY